MARVTSKRQVTIPQAIAKQYGIAPGDEILFEPAGSAIRVRRALAQPSSPDRQRRLDIYDRATERQQDRQRERGFAVRAECDWRREDLYERDSAR